MAGNTRTSPTNYEMAAGATDIWTFALRHADGTDIATASVSTITLTVREEAGGTIVNSRNAQNVKGANGGTLSLGSFVFQLSAADTAMVNGTDNETHLFEFTFTLTDGQVNREYVRVKCVAGA